MSEHIQDPGLATHRVLKGGHGHHTPSELVYRLGLQAARQVHTHQTRQVLEEDDAHETWQKAALDAPVVYVERDNRHGGRARDNPNGDGVVDAEQGQLITCGWHRLGDQNEKHGYAEQGGDADADLFGAAGREVEAEKGDQSDEQTGEDHVEEVEERAASHHQLVVNLRIRLLAARVIFQVACRGQIDQVPLAVLYIVCGVSLVRVNVYVEEVAVEGPAGEDHVACLLIEGKVAHVDATRRLEDDRGEPGDVAVEVDNGVC